MEVLNFAGNCLGIADRSREEFENLLFSWDIVF